MFWRLTEVEGKFRQTSFAAQEKVGDRDPDPRMIPNVAYGQKYWNQKKKKKKKKKLFIYLFSIDWNWKCKLKMKMKMKLKVGYGVDAVAAGKDDGV